MGTEVAYTGLTRMASSMYISGQFEELTGDLSEDEGSAGSSEADERGYMKVFDCSGQDTSKTKPAVVMCKCGQPFTDNSAWCASCGAKRPIEQSPIEALQNELEATRHHLGDTQRRLQEAREASRKKELHLLTVLDQQAQEEQRLLEAMERHSLPTIEGPKPPGPRSLRFVEGNCFTCISSMVIIFNVAFLLYQTSHPKEVETFNWSSSFFLAFYTVELFLKVLLWRKLFLCGPWDMVAWHLLDLIIVAGGIMNMVILPLLAPGFGGMRLLGALRILRLARLLKLVRNFIIADSSWAEGETFQIFVMSLIAISSIIMGLECDWPSLTKFLDTIYWEHVVLAIFLFELAVRLKNAGLHFFCDRLDYVWNWLDFMVVGGGVLDLWFLPFMHIIGSLITGQPVTYNSGSMGSVVVLLRMARLLRVLRLVRLVRQVPQLFTLLSGIAQAMAGMVWVLILTLVVLYFFALLSVKLFRDGMAYDGDAPRDVQDLFHSVPDSIFVLFTVMDGHKSILDPLLDSLPLTKVIFMAFVMVSEWAMLSILTAVVSENMIAVTEARRGAQEEAEKADAAREKDERMGEIVRSIDVNKDGSINISEFEAMLKDEAKRSDLCDAAQLNVADLRLMFNLIERNGRVSYQDFMEACHQESKSVSERSLMRLEKRLTGVEEKISTTVVVVEGAGVEVCNGTYVERGEHNMKPLYSKMDHSDGIIYFDFLWKMNDTSDTTTWRYHMANVEDLPLGMANKRGLWVAHDESSGSLPRVKWESHHLLDKRIEYLESLVVDTHRNVSMLAGRMRGLGHK
mmetsp:Transcript_132362/g.411452  ORF Transcript_132362/g.411452 Transcript_132362/m.411452 type:complete len:797 (-) Transcript_132362:94-2484(-)